MTESILLSLLSTISSILFNSVFQEPKKISIEAAPNWYGKYNNSKYIIAYGYSNSNKDFLSLAKTNCKENMIEEIETLLNRAISLNKKNINTEFNEFRTTYINNQNYKSYFSKELNFEKISHQFEKNQTFSKCTINKSSFLAYQKEVLSDINKNFSFYIMNKKQQELENEVKKYD